MQSIAETCVHFDAAHLSINLVSEGKWKRRIRSDAHTDMDTDQNEFFSPFQPLV